MKVRVAFSVSYITPQLMEKINEQLDFVDGWLDNVEADDYKPIDNCQMQTIPQKIAR